MGSGVNLCEVWTAQTCLSEWLFFVCLFLYLILDYWFGAIEKNNGLVISESQTSTFCGRRMAFLFNRFPLYLFIGEQPLLTAFNSESIPNWGLTSQATDEATNHTLQFCSWAWWICGRKTVCVLLIYFILFYCMYLFL